MNIEIPDEKARTTLEGLRAGDPTVISYLIQVLEEEVQSLEAHPIEVFNRGQSRDH